MVFLLAFSIFDKDRNLFPTFTETFKSAKYNHKKFKGSFKLQVETCIIPRLHIVKEKKQMKGPQ